jgi:very-short-patch-repair endonuclease
VDEPSERTHTSTTLMGMAFDPTQPFLRADGLEHGLTEKAMRGPGYRRLFRNVLVASTTPATPLQRVRGALALQCEQAWASHVSAARVKGAPVPTIADEHISVSHQKLRRHHRGLRCHVGDPAGVVVERGVRVSGDIPMFIELSGQLTLVDLVVVGDWLVRRRGVTPEQLVRACERSRHRDRRKAMAAAAYVRRDVDSPMETRLRMLLVLAGLPEPEINLAIRDDVGEVIRRYDLSYPAARVAVEYDGKVHVEVLARWEDDLERRADMDEAEWRLVVVVGSGIYRNPLGTLQRVHRALLARRLPGVPLRLSDDWRPHFPGFADAA